MLGKIDHSVEFTFDDAAQLRNKLIPYSIYGSVSGIGQEARLAVAFGGALGRLYGNLNRRSDLPPQWLSFQYRYVDQSSDRFELLDSANQVAQWAGIASWSPRDWLAELMPQHAPANWVYNILRPTLESHLYGTGNYFATEACKALEDARKDGCSVLLIQRRWIARCRMSTEVSLFISGRQTSCW